MNSGIFSWTQLILLSCLVQALFLISLLVRNKQKKNLILATIIFLAIVQLTLFSFDGVYDYLGCALTNIFSRLIFTLYGPLLYFYVLYTLNPKRLFKYKDLYHYMLFLIMVILSTWSYMTWDASEGAGWIHYIANTHMFAPEINEIIRWSHLAIYFIVSFRSFVNQKRLTLNEESNTVQMKWLLQFLIGFVALWTVVAIGLRLNYFSGDPNSNSLQFLFMSICVFVYWINYWLISKPILFQGSFNLKPATIIERKYRNSGLKDTDLNQIQEQLLIYMKEKKPYLNSDLRLEDLSVELKLSRYHLSQILNERMKNNFYDFVNAFRIRDAKKMLSDSSLNYLTIEAIAFDCGFNSKSTFINVFKKIENDTPGNYRKNKNN